MADGDNMVLGSANDSVASTSITRSGMAINTALVVSNETGPLCRARQRSPVGV